MAQVELKQINKVYGLGHSAVHAVQDLDLNINDGEFIALLGPSGCGKTSTLRMIVGLEEITSGEVCFDNKSVNDLTPEQRNVAMAFETYALYPNFTVAENIGFPLEVRGVPQAERQAQVLRMAELLRIENILEQTPASLSGGQQQRVGLGRALVRNPDMLILDEVLSHIDAHLKFQMLFDLKRIHQDLGKTTLFVTHDQVEALALADRVAVMSNARLQQIGTRNELYHSPANVFVADFIGEPPTNFFEVEYDSSNTTLRCQNSNLMFQPRSEQLEKLKKFSGSKLKIGLRPQNLSLKQRSDTASLTADVWLNEYLGEQTILTLRNGNDEFRAIAHPDIKCARGEQVTLYYAPNDVMVFDQAENLAGDKADDEASRKTSEVLIS